MPNIINQTFFIEPIDLPNLTNQAEIDRLTGHINKLEPECLLRILGYPLYKLFGTESSSRMSDLLNGAEYTDGIGNMQKWQGLKHNTTISLIANYVYFYIMQAKAAHNAGVGTHIPKKEAGNAISPSDKMTNAWNFFSSEVDQMSFFLWLKKDNARVRVYPEFSYFQFNETRRITRKIDSVFQF